MPTGTDNTNEAHARIKINKKLEEAGWRFFGGPEGPANIQLEAGTTITTTVIDALGEDFENTSHGKIDFLLLDSRGFPLLVLEAKAESKNPLDGKEQARTYARSKNCRFIILSNGNMHYFWDLERGNPYVISKFPDPGSVTNYKRTTPNPRRLVEETVNEDYIALTQRPSYASEAGYVNEAERPAYIAANKLRFLRPYQLRGLHALQRSVNDGNDRFLYEMATGTGKTLLSAAVIKLFLRTANASRVLFLVDRLELEDQAYKNFVAYLKDDYTCMVYKENRNNWRQAHIVVSTVQSLQFNNRYLQVFSPTDFDLVVSDEAHRSIGGNARAVFDFFVGYKLGLTATPRDYLRKFNENAADPREHERRLLLDTYKTFGCDGGQPTFRYSLVDGVKDGFLISPTVVDARTDITTQLLAEEGFVVNFTDEDGNEQEESYQQRQFEKKFFAGATNEIFCKTFMENGLLDPVTGEFGKSIVFAVSQNHASKLTQILNQMADVRYPGKYNSDFAVQVTSRIPDSQQFTKNFANNNLLGSAHFNPAYKTSKARVCVTVGMMTTGYDCPDLLNLALMRPVFSPTDFVQMKGRGTRKHDFREHATNPELKESIANPDKTAFKLFDFFANCDYFENEFNYDEVIKLPRPTGGDDEGGGGEGPPPPPPPDGAYEHLGGDILATMSEQLVGLEGMKIDRMYFQRFEEAARSDAELAEAVENGRWDQVINHVNEKLFDQPDEYYTLDKLRKAAAVDRRVSLREILEKVFGLIHGFKSKDQLLEEEFEKFITRPLAGGFNEAIGPADYAAVKTYFKAYATNKSVQHIIDNKDFTALNTLPGFSMPQYKAVPENYRALIPEYIKDYVPLNQFA